ncbi:transposase [Pseudarthrobacter oxydans]|uniref:transposase n=1 Tax=Pseudarthrobacter oxydans TaxID=1671 RepID=UPI0015732EE0|nr:transposase [Pseudarthrobacter oxydans]
MADDAARFPALDTVYWNFQRWNEDGTTDRLHDALRDAVWQAAGRNTAASAGIVDSQSVKGADTVGSDSRGYDAGKKVNGRKRHIVTDTTGLLVAVLVTAASLQDRDGGRPVLERSGAKMPSLVRVWADGGHAGKLVETVRDLLGITLDIVKKPEGTTPSRYCPGVGWLNAPCPGWCAAGAWAGTTSASRATRRPWSSGP